MAGIRSHTELQRRLLGLMGDYQNTELPPVSRSDGLIKKASTTDLTDVPALQQGLLFPGGLVTIK